MKHTYSIITAGLLGLMASDGCQYERPAQLDKRPGIERKIHDYSIREAREIIGEPARHLSDNDLEASLKKLSKGELAFVMDIYQNRSKIYEEIQANQQENQQYQAYLKDKQAQDEIKKAFPWYNPSDSKDPLNLATFKIKTMTIHVFSPGFP